MAAQMIEYALYVALRELRRFPDYERDQSQARWSPQPARSRGELVIGVLGLGVLGGAVAQALRTARTRLTHLQETYGGAALDYLEGRSPTMRAFTAAERKTRREIDELNARIAALAQQQRALPARVTLAEAQPNETPVKLSTDRKHLTNVLKLVAFQIESDLVELIRPHYARADEEGRTLIQTALQSTAAIDPTADELRVTLAPLSAPHRSRAVAALCQALTSKETMFPGTTLRLRFAVADAPNSGKSGQLSEGVCQEV